VPFVVNIDCGLAVDIPDIASDLLVGQGPALCVFFRAAAVPVPQLRSPAAADVRVPFTCCEVAGMVVVDAVEEAEEIEEEELAR
jgi:hypothetical protein